MAAYLAGERRFQRLQARRRGLRRGVARARPFLAHLAARCRSGQGQHGARRVRRHRFLRARFDQTQLDELRAQGCDFSDAKLVDLTLDKARLSDCRFDRAHLSSVDFLDESELHRVRFDHARLRKVSWYNCAVSGMIFAGAALDTCDWTDSECHGGIDFSDARVESTCFVGSSKLGGANFQRAVLIDCNLRERGARRRRLHRMPGWTAPISRTPRCARPRWWAPMRGTRASCAPTSPAQRSSVQT
ncbi:pentapeptide repeats (9 copies) domain-containing protein [Ditylenchus destructor]|uniref:Pentapeptide repeats (9 copies) domain-containing protein n=1 Tax=Ditylenchus destructor TaxID=166010 RepID=A0AAD4MF00_9BILA|nr:pentapeptide repeats (9 copies) domain-containing protein [Ditylenchus destructor]